MSWIKFNNVRNPYRFNQTGNLGIFGKHNLNDGQWDQKYYDSLIGNQQYEQAATYANMFYFDDPEVQKDYANGINNLRQQGRIYGAIYGRLKQQSDYSTNRETSDYAKFEFANAFENGTLGLLKNNKYAEDFINFKNNLGGKNTTTLSITFANPKHRFLGIDSEYTDRLIPDDDEYSFDTFLSNSGITYEQLQNAGVNVSKDKDGAYTIKFDKNNILSNKILYNIPHDGGSLLNDPYGGTARIKIKGFYNNGNPNTEFDHDAGNKTQLTAYYNPTIKECFDRRDQIMKGNGFDEVSYYSSTIGASLIDGMDDLEVAYANNMISATQYKQELGKVQEFIANSGRVLNSGQYEMYSDYGGGSNAPLDFVDNENRGYLVDLITATDPKNIGMYAMVSNGKVGTLFVIDAVPAESKDLDRDTELKDRTKSSRIQIFVPGFLQEEAQKKIDSDTALRTTQELDNMKRYGYEYKTINNQTIKWNNSENSFISYGRPISEEEVARLIDRNMILEQTIPELRYQYSNDYGQIYDYDKLNNAIKKSTIGIASYLYPNVSFTGADGKPINLSNIKTENIDYILNKAHNVLLSHADEDHHISHDEAELYRSVWDTYCTLMREVYGPDLPNN